MQCACAGIVLSFPGAVFFQPADLPSIYAFTGDEALYVVKDFTLNRTLKRIEKAVFRILIDLPLRWNTETVVLPDEFKSHGRGEHVLVFRFQKQQRRIVPANISAQRKRLKTFGIRLIHASRGKKLHGVPDMREDILPGLENNRRGLQEPARGFDPFIPEFAVFAAFPGSGAEKQ